MPVSQTHLAPLDLTLVALYLIGITVFGLQFSRRSRKLQQEKSLKSYFLADNTIPWWAIALSIVSAETSTLTIISIPGVAYAGNLGFLQVVLGYMLGRIVVAALFLPRYFRGEMLTAYQLIDRRFGSRLHKLTAGLFLLTRAAAEGVRVFAISIVVSLAIGTGDILSIAIISALTLLYTFEGGMAAVIWTDVVQMALYVAGTVVALLTLGAHVPGGWPHIHAVAAPLGKFHWLDFSFTLARSYTFWAGILGGTFLTMASHGTDQLMVQRMLAARNLRESRLALLSSGIVIFIQFTLFLVIGVGLFVFYAAHPQPFKTNDFIFPTFIVQQMPHGIAGLLVAAILAAAMSNLSAALNSLASTTVIDFYVPFKVRASQKFLLSSRSEPLESSRAEPLLSSRREPLESSRSETLLSFRSNAEESAVKHSPPLNTDRISKLATIFWAIVLFLIATYSVKAGGKGHVVETGLSIASVAYGCLLGVFLLGTLTRYATQTGAILGMITGLVTNLALYQSTWPIPFLPMPNLPHIAFTWYVLIGSLITFAIGSLFSLLPRKQALALILLLVCGLGCPRITQAQASVITGSVTAQPAAETPAQPTAQLYDFHEVDALITQAIAQHKIPGAVVLIGHNGAIAYTKAYGNRALTPAPLPMLPDTLFDMASLTKVLVTTTAILELSDDKLLDLDAPVAQYLPDFAANNKAQITLRQLLTHYSGLPEDVDLKDPWGLAKPDPAEGLRRALAAVPYGPPGLTFRYSDINFITLGAVVEKVSGEPLDVFAHRHIFAPLIMPYTGYHPFAKTCGPATRIGSAVTPGPPVAKNTRILTACAPFTWLPNGPGLETAPTARDDQGTPATNPNFGNILLGTVHDPTTRRMGGVAGHAGVFSNINDTARFAQALLDKLLHNTGPFPVSQASLQQAITPNEALTAVHTATIFTQAGQTITGEAQRGLGWDLNTAFSRPRGEIFPLTSRTSQGSFGHTGFTGTSLWIDPVSDTYVILLTNAIHIPGATPISTLRGQVATAAAKALNLTAPGVSHDSSRPPCDGRTTGCPGVIVRASTLKVPASAPSSDNTPLLSFRSAAEESAFRTSAAPAQKAATDKPPAILTGIDVLEQTNFAALKSLAHPANSPVRIGLLTNQSGLDAHGHRTIDILHTASSEIELKTIFTPEHGLLGKQDTEHLASEQDPTTHIPVISLYGAKSADRHPKQSDLKQLDAVVIDLQDAGVRFWTYEAVLGYFLEATSKANIPLIVLDRPNPIGGGAPQGPLSAPGYESYTNFMPLPVRHGLTFGELARTFNAFGKAVQLDPRLLGARAATLGTETPDALPPATQPGLHANLIVIPMQNWHRAEYYADTGLPWTPPSPNLKTLAATILYPALGLTEQTNVSVGRGTPTPFEDLGAAFLNGPELAAYLTARKIPGVSFTATTYPVAETPEHYPGHGASLPGIHFNVRDRAAFDSPELGLELLAALHHLYPKDFHLSGARTLLANPSIFSALEAGQDPRDILAGQTKELADFRAATRPFLLYE